MTAYEHAWQIRDADGFRAFEDAAVTAAFRQFLDGRAWTHVEGPGALFTQGPHASVGGAPRRLGGR